MKLENVKFRNPGRGISELLHLLPEFKFLGEHGENSVPNNTLVAIHQHCDNLVAHLFRSVEVLGRVLVDVSHNKDGCIDNDDIGDLGFLIKTLGVLGHGVFNVKEHAMLQLSKRGVDLNLE